MFKSIGQGLTHTKLRGRAMTSGAGRIGASDQVMAAEISSSGDRAESGMPGPRCRTGREAVPISIGMRVETARAIGSTGLKAISIDKPRGDPAPRHATSWRLAWRAAVAAPVSKSLSADARRNLLAPRGCRSNFGYAYRAQSGWRNEKGPQGRRFNKSCKMDWPSVQIRTAMR